MNSDANSDFQVEGLTRSDDYHVYKIIESGKKFLKIK